MDQLNFNQLFHGAPHIANMSKKETSDVRFPVVKWGSAGWNKLLEQGAEREREREWVCVCKRIKTALVANAT